MKKEERTLIEQQGDNERLARSKLLVFLEKREAGSVTAQENVYGSAIAMPQIARSMGWPGMITRNTIRSYFFLLFNIFVQGSLLYYVSMESGVVAPFGGQMHLCNFGANIRNCPEAEGCVGPYGTKYTPSRLYAYGAIADRSFARDSLLAVMPEKADLIKSKVDVGEYGVESSSCRLLCVFLFMVAMISEFWSIQDMVLLLYHVPSEEQSWVSYEVPKFDTKEKVKEIRGCSELDFITIKVAGIPLRWKICNVILIVLPKALIFKILCEVGVNFLMETAAMVDVVVNSCALGFITSMDEVFFQTFTKDSTRFLMEKLERFDLFDCSAEEDHTDDMAHGAHDEHDKVSWDWHKVVDLIPTRFLVSIAMTAWFVSDYYHKYCIESGDGTMVSRPMYLPKSFSISLFSVFFPRFFPEDLESDAFWNPPPEN